MFNSIKLFVIHSTVHSDLILLPGKTLFYAILDMYIGGIETTGTAMSWLILYMMKYQEVQEKCQAEIEQVNPTQFDPTPEIYE